MHGETIHQVFAHFFCFRENYGCGVTVKFSELTACPGCCLWQGTLHHVGKSRQLHLKDRKASNDHRMANQKIYSSRSMRGSPRANFGHHAFLPFCMSTVAGQARLFDFPFIISSHSLRSCERRTTLHGNLTYTQTSTVCKAPNLD